MAIKVTIWNEFRHEKSDPAAHALYPDGLHACIKKFLEEDPEIRVRLAAVDDPDQGLPDEVLNDTDVLIWWGHMAHGEVSDALVERIRNRVYRNGMGFMPIHSGHHSKPFRAIVGTTGDLTWGREQTGIVWNMCPSHPIAKGIPAQFSLQEEMYGEPFFIPKPDDLIFATWFEDGNLFRGGVTYTRGLGKIFYFHPGHETCPSYHNPYVQQILRNAVHWVAPDASCEICDPGCVSQDHPVFQKN